MKAYEKLSEHIHKTKMRNEYWLTAARLKCADGFTVSVQAGQGTYCLPRDDQGPWTHFECGFPSQSIPEWSEWRDSEDIFAYVPAKEIWKVLEAHGGVVNLGVRLLEIHDEP